MTAPDSPRIPAAILDEEACWQAVTTRDRSRDGQFVFGVVTTGVFCRPSCPARSPRRQNVRFFPTVAEAARAGLRPCRRCRPLEPSQEARVAAVVAAACAFIRAHAGEPLTLDLLASRSGLSRFHFQRTFKSAVGITPTQYIEACRLAAFKRQLRRGRSVTDAVYDAGFGSGSRIYERVDSRLGMTPAQYRARGQGVTVACGSAKTPLGTLMVGATDRGVCFVQFGESHEALLAAIRSEYPAAEVREMSRPYSPQFDAWMRSLLDHLAGAPQSLDVPVDVRATAFQLKVWRYLQSIPRGEVRTYAEVARAVGSPGAVRAVGRACAANPVALVVPCHRVIRGDGGLGGYRWGPERKRALLDREGRATRAHPPR